MDAVTDNLDLFWSGFLRSLGICLWAMVGSLVLGTIIAAFRVSPVPSAALVRHGVGDDDPQLPADGGAVLLRVRPAGDRHQPLATTSSASPR